jgi:hypothetical protein
MVRRGAASFSAAAAVAELAAKVVDLEYAVAVATALALRVTIYAPSGGAADVPRRP